jgi:hypothetical protein
MDDRDHHGGGHPVAAHVGEQQPDPAAGQPQNVVIVAAGVGRRPRIDGQVERRNLRQVGRQQASLKLGDPSHFLLCLLVIGLQLLREQGGLSRPAEQVGHPHQIGEPFRGKCGRFLAGEHDHVHRLAGVEQWNGQKRLLTLGVRGGRVVGGDLQVFDDLRPAGV